MKKIITLLFLFLSVIRLDATPLQVIIIRHGEKNPENGQLLPKGIERAGALAAYLSEIDPTGTNEAFLLFGPPNQIFAARPINISDDQTVRCIQTVIPCAQKLKLPVHSPYSSGQEGKLAKLILEDRRYDGEVVLICWHHTHIADLIAAFGYTPPGTIIPYPERYDLVWSLLFPAPEPAQNPTLVLQELLFNDQSTFP